MTIKSEELKILVKEFEGRRHSGLRRELKNFGWRLTVWEIGRAHV